MYYYRLGTKKKAKKLFLKFFFLVVRPLTHPPPPLSVRTTNKKLLFLRLYSVMVLPHGPKKPAFARILDRVEGVRRVVRLLLKQTRLTDWLSEWLKHNRNRKIFVLRKKFYNRYFERYKANKKTLEQNEWVS